jgi:hypothetical protein
MKKLVDRINQSLARLIMERKIEEFTKDNETHYYKLVQSIGDENKEDL